MQLRVIAACAILLSSSAAEARTTKLSYVWGGNAAGGTGTKAIVFIHGHANCTESSGTRPDSRCINDSRGYWLNSKNDSGDGHDLMDEAASKCTASGCTATATTCSDPTTCPVNYTGTWKWWDAFAIRYNGNDQAMWNATNDVASCLVDLRNGTNTSGCNPSLYQRSQIYLVAHSEGGAIVDRIFSTGWWSSGTSNLTGSGGAIVGNPNLLAGALAGAKSASALHGTDGAGNFCTSLVSWLAGWAIADGGTPSLTRGSVIGEANNFKAGRSPRWMNKVTTTGGSGSCNNNGSYLSVYERTNDTALGTLCGCIGYSADDDTDGILWMYDTDPTSSPSTSNGGKYRAQYTGYYWRFIASKANHSHNRNDAYARTRGLQNFTGCVTDAPGSCVGQYGIE